MSEDNPTKPDKAPSIRLRNGSRSAAGGPWLTKQTKVIAGVCLVSLATRLIDSPLSNFSSMAALALLCGSVVRHPAGVLVPLAVRLLTDVLVQIKTGYGFFPSWPFDYTAYLLIFCLGRFVMARSYKAVFGGAIASVAVYFVLSNFGVWLMWPDTYPRTIAGLTDCFAMAIPFARGTVLGNLIAAPFFFGVWNAVSASLPKPAAATDVAIAGTEK